MKTPQFAARRGSKNRGITQQVAARARGIPESALMNALKTDSIFTSIMSDNSTSSPVKKKNYQQNHLDDIVRKRLNSQLHTAPMTNFDPSNMSSRAQSNPRNRPRNTADFIELNKRMSVLHGNMGKGEAGMGNSNYMRHLEAVGEINKAFALTQLKEESKHELSVPRPNMHMQKDMSRS